MVVWFLLMPRVFVLVTAEFLLAVLVAMTAVGAMIMGMGVFVLMSVGMFVAMLVGMLGAVLVGMIMFMLVLVRMIMFVAVFVVTFHRISP